jgi:tripartite-type tricarboxylate transporter receptor subunit TctC
MNVERLLCLFFCAVACASAGAQGYPAKPVRFVVPYPPGGSNDVLSRITAQAMSPGLSRSSSRTAAAQAA